MTGIVSSCQKSTFHYYYSTFLYPHSYGIVPSSLPGPSVPYTHQSCGSKIPASVPKKHVQFGHKYFLLMPLNKAFNVPKNVPKNVYATYLRLFVLSPCVVGSLYVIGSGSQSYHTTCNLSPHYFLVSVGFFVGFFVPPGPIMPDSYMWSSSRSFLNFAFSFLICQSTSQLILFCCRKYFHFFHILSLHPTYAVHQQYRFDFHTQTQLRIFNYLNYHNFT